MQERGEKVIKSTPVQVNGRPSSESRLYVVSTIFKADSGSFDAKVRGLPVRERPSVPASRYMQAFRHLFKSPRSAFPRTQVFTLKAQSVDPTHSSKGPQTFAKGDIDVSKYATASPTSVSKPLDLVMEPKARAAALFPPGGIPPMLHLFPSLPRQSPSLPPQRIRLGFAPLRSASLTARAWRRRRLSAAVTIPPAKSPFSLHPSFLAPACPHA